MAPRNRSILTMLPWWSLMILSSLVYLSKYLITFHTSPNNFLMAPEQMMTTIMSGALFVIAILSAFNTWRKGDLLERQQGIRSIRSISWQEFEELVGEAYKRKGYSVTETGGGGADGGVDLILKRGDENLLVQCKHWKIDKVGVKVVRELFGVVAAEGASGGIIISSGTFTQEAIDFARGKTLELVNGSDLVKLVAEVQKKQTASAVLKPKDNICPLCGKQMVLRTAKKGSNVGEKFWGCSAFPKCRGTRQYIA